jgi:hypothetical protein
MQELVQRKQPLLNYSTLPPNKNKKHQHYTDNPGHADLLTIAQVYLLLISLMILFESCTKDELTNRAKVFKYININRGHPHAANLIVFFNCWPSSFLNRLSLVVGMRSEPHKRWPSRKPAIYIVTGTSRLCSDDSH